MDSLQTPATMNQSRTKRTNTNNSNSISKSCPHRPPSRLLKFSDYPDLYGRYQAQYCSVLKDPSDWYEDINIRDCPAATTPRNNHPSRKTHQDKTSHTTTHTSKTGWNSITFAVDYPGHWDWSVTDLSLYCLDFSLETTSSLLIYIAFELVHQSFSRPSQRCRGFLVGGGSVQYSWSITSSSISSDLLFPHSLQPLGRA